MKTKCPMKVGRCYRFSFPRHNFDGVRSPMDVRHLRVESIRDLTKKPIERLTFDLQPLLRRGRFLVTGQDLDKQTERSFYFDSMADIAEIQPPVLLTVFLISGTSGVVAELNESRAMRAAKTMANETGSPAKIEAVQISTTAPKQRTLTVTARAVKAG